MYPNRGARRMVRNARTIVLATPLWLVSLYSQHASAEHASAEHASASVALANVEQVGGDGLSPTGMTATSSAAAEDLQIADALAPQASACCDDGNECTDDKCILVICKHENVPNDKPCAGGKGRCIDGNCCTGCVDGSGKCQDGKNLNACGAGGQACIACESGKNQCSAPVCEEGKCSLRAVPDGTLCANSDACDGVELCVSGECKAGTPPNCDDANPCTDDRCDAEKGCIHSSSTKACEDGDACTTGDTCTDGHCVGKPIVCDDHNPCTNDTCNAKQGCKYAPLADSTVCDDGNACTENDSCKAGKCEGVGKRCDDSNPCTQNTCDAAKQSCNFPSEKDGTPCNDPNDLCHIHRVCQKGQCSAGDPVGCDDANPCTAEQCLPTQGCVYTTVANGTACQAAGSSGMCRDGQCIPRNTDKGGSAGTAGTAGAATTGGGGNSGVTGGSAGQGGSSGSAGHSQAGTGPGSNSRAGRSGKRGTDIDEDSLPGTHVREPGGCACVLPMRAGGTSRRIPAVLVSLAALWALRRRRRHPGAMARDD